MEPLKPNDDVYIESLGVYGKVVRARIGDAREPEDQKSYEIQIKGYFLRTDLKLYDTAAERAKREDSLQQKTERLALARQNVEHAMATGADIKTATGIELLQAATELSKAMKDS